MQKSCNKLKEKLDQSECTRQEHTNTVVISSFLTTSIFVHSKPRGATTILKARKHNKCITFGRDLQLHSESEISSTQGQDNHKFAFI